MADDSQTPENLPAAAPSLLQVLTQVWRSINERKMVQWTIAYVALAYSLQHGVQLTSEAFKWEGVTGLSMLLLALGLPVVVTIAWYHGERGRQHISGPELTIISTLFVIGTLLFAVFVRPAEPSVAASRVPPNSPNGISIAVLPFANMSGDAGQEFFSDGMSEEISSALSNVQSLRVIGRTSASQFKGQNKDLRAIGQALGVGYLIEGSVRKVGDRVRITAQLVKADDAVRLWSQNYDRQLTDIFAAQEDIAQAIAGALSVPLGLRQGDSLVRNRTEDLVSYDEYLQAKALYRARNLSAAIKLLEPVVARDPGYAPAWGLLAQVYVVARNFSFEVRSGSVEEARLFVQTTQEKAEMAAREAIRLNPRDAISYSVLARVQAYYRGNWGAGDDLYKQALALDPNEPDVLLNYAVTLQSEGRLKESLNTVERLRRVEPFVPIFSIVAAHNLHLNGQLQASIALFGAIPPAAGGGYFRNLWLAEAYAAAGRYAEAADTLLLMPSDQINRRSVEDAARILRSAPAKVAAPQTLPELNRELGFVYAYVGAPDRMIENYSRQFETKSGFDETIWLPEFAALRKTQPFKAAVRKFELVDYWRERGWPDLCRPMGANDFVCT